MSLPQALLDVLVCPRCKGALEYRPVDDALDCRRCLLRYPVRDNIPVMLVDEAEPLAQA